MTKPIILGKTLSAIPQGGSGQIAVYRGIGKAPVDTGERIRVGSFLGVIQAGKFVIAEEFLHGWEILHVED